MTVKMRLGWDDESLTAPALARAFEQVGVAAVIVHGRTRQQGFTGDVNRAGIRAVVEAVERIPVVANGDIRTIADAAATFRGNRLRGHLDRPGALANPFIFRQLDCWARTGEPGPRAGVRRTARADAPPLPRAGRCGAASTTAACSSARSSSGIPTSRGCPSRITAACSTSRASSLFDEVIEAVQAAGPESPLPGHYEFHVPVPSGAIDKW